MYEWYELNDCVGDEAVDRTYWKLQSVQGNYYLPWTWLGF